MKKLIINGKQEYVAEKIIKEGNRITLIGVVDDEGRNIGNLLFPNISNIDEYELADGQEWDLPEQLQQDLRIAEAYESLYNEMLMNSLALAEVYELIVGGED